MALRRSGKEGILTTLTNACTLLALNASCLGFYKDYNQIELTYVFESAYFLLIFSFHLLDKLLHTNLDLTAMGRGLPPGESAAPGAGGAPRATVGSPPNG